MPTFQERAARLRGGGGASEGIEYFIETIKSFDIELLGTFIALTFPPLLPWATNREGQQGSTADRQRHFLR